MKNYEVSINEIHEYLINVKAQSETEALHKAPRVLEVYQETDGRCDIRSEIIQVTEAE